MTQSRLHPDGSPARAHRGFSMVELLVVMIILGMLAALVLPRMLGTQGRQAEVEAQSVRSLLSQLGQLDATTSDALSLRFQTGSGDDEPRLSIERVVEKDGKAEWQPLKSTRPLRLSLITLAAVQSDGQPQPVDAEWRIVCEPSRPRPTISLLLDAEAGFGAQARAWQIDLLSAQPTAVLRETSPGAGLQSAAANAEDLDAQGKRTTAW